MGGGGKVEDSWRSSRRRDSARPTGRKEVSSSAGHGAAVIAEGVYRCRVSPFFGVWILGTAGVEGV